MRSYYKQTSCALRARAIFLRLMNATTHSLPVPLIGRFTPHATIYFPSWQPQDQAYLWCYVRAAHIRNVLVGIIDNSIPKHDTEEALTHDPSRPHYYTRTAAFVEYL